MTKPFKYRISHEFTTKLKIGMRVVVTIHSNPLNILASDGNYTTYRSVSVHSPECTLPTDTNLYNYGFRVKSLDN